MNPHSHQRKRPPPGNRKGLNAVVNQQNTPYDQFDYQATNRIQSPPPVYVAGDFEDRPCHGHSAQELSVSEVSPSVGGWGTTHTQQPSDSVAHHPPWNSIWTPDYGVLSSYQIPPREVQLPPLDQALGEAWRQRDPFAEGIEGMIQTYKIQCMKWPLF
ncbi:hypothetical protein N7478_009540 [Penicillium angulare]|uniref:uncharacterized protein n=1 Tax=Penicillium angulare TaxID=116970 RepID=UPI00253FEB44|nr:uncharacterized protein N7478_009540 [Penicillium angulare]KAJ5266732.1 hypothetical protein N7478_009540 [Penicillium angulare]